MAQSQPDFGWHTVAFLDVLGQRSKLQQITALPRSAGPERDELVTLLKDTVLFVSRLRQHCLNFFEAYSVPTGALGGLSAEQQASVEAGKRSPTLCGFSDSLTFSVALGGRHSIIGVRGTLIAASAAMCFSLSERKVLRGGIDVGLACKFNEGDTYGPALERAYYLESAVASSP